MRRTCFPWLLPALLSLGSAACGGRAQDLGESRAPPGQDNPAGGASAGGGASGRGTASGSTGAGGLDVTNADGGTTGTGGTGGTPDVVPLDLLREPTVWIGQVSPAVTYPTVLQEGVTPEKVVLILDAIRQSVVSGTIAFGEGPGPGADPIAAYPTRTDSTGASFPTLSVNWNYSPFPGFPFSLLSSELKGNRLAIDFAPDEIWGAWCMAQDPAAGSPPDPFSTPSCDCAGTTCGVSLRRLDLVVTGDTMEGEMTRLPGNWLGGVPDIKLKRVQ